MEILINNTYIIIDYDFNTILLKWNNSYHLEISQCQCFFLLFYQSELVLIFSFCERPSVYIYGINYLSSLLITPYAKLAWFHFISVFRAKKQSKKPKEEHKDTKVGSYYHDLKGGTLSKTIVILLVLVCSILHYFYYCLHFTFRFIMAY